jgi:hypothetical protein
MTAVTKEAPRTPPRALVRVFWVLHRAMYRLSGGRFGVSGDPRPGRGSGR